MGYLALDGYIVITATADGSPMSAVMKINTPGLHDIKVKTDNINGKVYAGDLNVTVKSGNVDGWSLVSPVDIIITPTHILNSKLDGKYPITVGDNGSANGTFKMGDSTTSKLITLTVTNSGQDKVAMT